jgi:hypothetical protein
VFAWFKRFGMHLAAAIGATGIFVAAAAVGASQTRQHTASTDPALVAPAASRTARPQASVDGDSAAASPSPRPRATPRPTRVVPERSLAGTVQAVTADELDVMGIGGRLWHVAPAPGALIRLNGKAARLDTLQTGDTVVILGQAQANQGPGNHFLAHAITARRK